MVNHAEMVTTNCTGYVPDRLHGAVQYRTVCQELKACAGHAYIHDGQSMHAAAYNAWNIIWLEMGRKTPSAELYCKLT